MSAADDAVLAISLGSSLVVYPAADVPMRATAHGAPYAIVNLGATDHDGDPRVTLRIDGDVTEVFPAAVAHALA
jgi:NAD-dependent deacetylase